MKRIKVNGVELCVETFEDPADSPVLLVGITMLSWPDELCAAGYGHGVASAAHCHWSTRSGLGHSHATAKQVTRKPIAR